MGVAMVARVCKLRIVGEEMLRPRRKSQGEEGERVDALRKAEKPLKKGERNWKGEE